MKRRDSSQIKKVSALAVGVCVVLAGCTRSDNGAPVHWGYGQSSTATAVKVTSAPGKSEQNLVRQARNSARSSSSAGRDDRTIRVGDGDTVYSIARHHSLDVNKLIKRNDLRPPYTIRPGQRLSVKGVDRVTYASAATSGRGGPQEHIVAQNDTLYSLSKKYGMSVDEIRGANGLSGKDVIRPGQTLVMSGSGEVQYAEATPKAKPGSPSVRSTRTETWQSKLVGAPTPKPNVKSKPVQTASLRESLPSEGAGSFIWPVKGRVISDYGKKPNGLFNDGVNIAVQPGTPVRASKSGLVTYAGNELKGYGNLLLIKHDDGHVTAYAHNSRLLVRPGDKVRQGDVVAESGSTGAVTSPQVHFEIRRGRKSINPGFLFAAD